jgi:membrane dipeptidase
VTSLSRAEALLRSSPLVDGHNDLPWALRLLYDGDLSKFDVSRLHPATHTDLPRLRTGGVGAQFWSVYVPSTLPGEEAAAAVLEQIDLVHRLVTQHPDSLGLAVTAEQVRQQFADGRIASLLGAEGGHCLNESLAVLRTLHDLGVRYLTLTHNDNVPWADSATDEPLLGGLNDFGRHVVREMNRLGMLVDLSHVSPDTMRHALDTTAAPVVFSHSSCRALVDHPRNVPDDVLQRLAGNGGVCMVTFVPDFVSQECRDWALSPSGPQPRATLHQVADHLDHAREVAGVDHVGIGGDYDGCGELPEGLADVSCYPALFEELLDRGWSEQDLRKVAGENALRALSDAESIAEPVLGTQRAVYGADV